MYNLFNQTIKAEDKLNIAGRGIVYLVKLPLSERLKLRKSFKNKKKVSVVFKDEKSFILIKGFECFSGDFEREGVLPLGIQAEVLETLIKKPWIPFILYKG